MLVILVKNFQIPAVVKWRFINKLNRIFALMFMIVTETLPMIIRCGFLNSLFSTVFVTKSNLDPVLLSTMAQLNI